MGKVKCSPPPMHYPVSSSQWASACPQTLTPTVHQTQGLESVTAPLPPMAAYFWSLLEMQLPFSPPTQAIVLTLMCSHKWLLFPQV